ncbi:Protein CBG20012 [Caenorhabditis briggsae]|uniref:Protein CBG20012 n=1 Tax=Caenorhabditis briggsae TaxID=6238 RepID=A8XWX6_CAEBR|nr:Protein CBG20012 [Caenorhabditis briggsae]CAP37145.1 Protein CBG20012 [Caenorhabditis briggsae]
MTKFLLPGLPGRARALKFSSGPARALVGRPGILQVCIKGNFLPTILCFNEYPDTPSLEKCVERSIDCSEEAARVTSNIKNSVESNEGQNLMKKARKAFPIHLTELSKRKLNKAPKEQLCGLKSLKSQEACQPCRRS